MEHLMSLVDHIVKKWPRNLAVVFEHVSAFAVNLKMHLFYKF